MEIDTVYGVYKVHLGPTDSGEYLEVTCRGLPVLTERFSEHSLADLNEEVYRSGIVDRSVQLPRTLGGASVGLLMGITSTKTDPVLVYSLPNGLGIYRSPFKDRDGCSLAYGGPHEIFSRRRSSIPEDDGYSRFMGELHKIH